MKVLKKNSPKEEMKDYFSQQNNIRMFYNNSKNMIDETIKMEQDLDLGFDIDFKKYLTERK